MIGLLGKIPRYWLARRLGAEASLPVNVTVGLTYRCNSRCRTCRVYERHSEELSVGEWRRAFKALSRAPYWFTFSGGEPFLRRDTPEIVSSAIEICGPGVVNIPTNGLLTDRVIGGTDAVCAAHPGTNVIVNVSLDAIGARHDEIRGVPGAYEKAVATVNGLKALNHANLTVGIHTVISRFNVQEMDRICAGLLELEPDSYVTEVAEQRVELGTMGIDITPDADSYHRAVSQVESILAEHGGTGVPATVRAFRHQYYRMASHYLRSGETTIPCYAGLASAQIAPDGDVWFCCIRAESVGNLREVDFDFGRLWRSEAAQRLRESITRGDCACPLANAAYTNMLCHPPTMARVFWERLTSRVRRPIGARRHGPDVWQREPSESAGKSLP